MSKTLSFILDDTKFNLMMIQYSFAIVRYERIRKNVSWFRAILNSIRLLLDSQRYAISLGPWNTYRLIIQPSIIVIPMQKHIKIGLQIPSIIFIINKNWS